MRCAIYTYLSLRRLGLEKLDNVADLLTKALDPVPFDRLRRMLLNILAVGAIYPVPRARRIAAKRATATRD